MCPKATTIALTYCILLYVNPNKSPTYKSYMSHSKNLPLAAAFPPAHPPATHNTASSLLSPNRTSTFFVMSSSCSVQEASGLTRTFPSACSFGTKSMEPTHWKYGTQVNKSAQFKLTIFNFPLQLP